MAPLLYTVEFLFKAKKKILGLRAKGSQLKLEQKCLTRVK